MRKQKKARLLSMDDLQARPCEVDGRPALFHRWIEEDKALLRINSFTTPEAVDKYIYTFRECGIIDPHCSTNIIRETFALVEYKDGTIDKVKPELIRFVDREEAEG